MKTHVLRKKKNYIQPWINEREIEMEQSLLQTSWNTTPTVTGSEGEDEDLNGEDW